MCERIDKRESQELLFFRIDENRAHPQFRSASAIDLWQLAVKKMDYADSTMAAGAGQELSIGS